MTDRRVFHFIYASVVIMALAFPGLDTAVADEALDAKAEEYILSIFQPGAAGPGAGAGRAAGGPGRAFPDPTLKLAWVAQNWTRLGGDARERIGRYYNPEAGHAGEPRLALPRSAALRNQQTYITDHFYIYYSTTDPYNGVSSVAYVQMVADALEKSYHEEVTLRGFPRPPFPRGFDHFTVYIWDIIDCNFNIEMYDMFYQTFECSGMLSFAVPMGTKYPFEFFLALDHDFKGYTELMKVVVAHEFFHAIEFGRSNGPSLDGNLWYFEGQAVWAEDEVYPDVNDYIGYLQSPYQDCNDWFVCPYLPLTLESYDLYLRPYGASIFFKYLTDYKRHPQAVLHIQEFAVSLGGAVEALAAYAASSLGFTMPELMLDFGASFLSLDGYEDGGLMTPEIGFVPLEVDESFTLTQADTAEKIHHYGHRVFELTTGRGESSLRITPSGLSSGMKVGIYKCAARGSGCTAITEGSRINGFGESWPFVYLVAANGDSSNDAPSYSIRVDAGPMPVERSVALAPGGWNLLAFPADPASCVPAEVFSRDGFQLFLASPDPSYESMNEKDIPQPGLAPGAAVWVYPESGAPALLVSTENITHENFSFDLKPGEWNVITTPDLVNETPYNDSHVSLVINAKSYTLGEAADQQLVAPLYYYDPAEGGYRTLAPGSGALVPWRAYLMKPDVDGTLVITR